MIKQFLHVGCGTQNKNSLKGFKSDDWQEIRFDIDEKARPDIVGTLTDMRAIKSSSIDAIFSSHNIEHLYAHEVPTALKEFERVLKDDGFVIITCPDLQSVCQAVVNDKLFEPLYISPAGPISPIDILYGHRKSLANGNNFMAHKCGFTHKALDNLLQESGFISRAGLIRSTSFDIWILAYKKSTSEHELREVASRFFP